MDRIAPGRLGRRPHVVRDKPHDREITQPESIAPGIEYIDGVAATGDGMVLIHDLDRFLSLEEEQRLSESLTGSSGTLK